MTSWWFSPALERYACKFYTWLVTRMSKLQNKTTLGPKLMCLLLLLPGQALAPSNMHSRFSALLWLEELHAEKEMKEYAIHCTFLQKGGGHLHLEVPGVSEGRPSLNIGDGASFIFTAHNWAVALRFMLLRSHFAIYCLQVTKFYWRRHRTMAWWSNMGAMSQR